MNLMLDFLSICVLLICLFIARDIVKELGGKRGNEVKAFFFLRAPLFIKSMKVMISAIILWAIKDGIRLLSYYYPLDILDKLYDITGIVIAIVLSYGLYLFIILIKSSEGQIRLKAEDHSK